MVAVMAALAAVALVTGTGSSSADIITYTAQVTIPVAPASNFASTGGGDGWDISLTPDAVYAIYHHNSEMRVSCHKQVDASNCWTQAFKLVQDGAANNFGTSNQSATVIDPGNGHLYSYGTRSSDDAGGGVCIDTTLPADATNLFCGFTQLGDGGSFGSSSSLTAGVEIGTRFYAFNYSPVAGVQGTSNTLMCFDMSTQSACATPNLDVGLPPASTTIAPQASLSAVGNRVYIPLAMDTGTWLACFDSGTGAKCGGAWPLELPQAYFEGAPIPLMDTSGAITGVCLPNTDELCFTLAGAATPAPPGLGAAMGTTSNYNAVPLTLDDRVYIASWEGNTVRCYDFGASATCPNFPLSIQNASLLYTVNPDPQRPSCLWINADFGTAQIQNFDAFSGEACGDGAIRVLASAAVPAGPECTPGEWTRLQVLDPARADYTQGSVAFRDNNGGLIPGASDAPLDGTGGVDLTSQPLDASRPQFLLTLEGHNGPIGEVTIELTWSGERLASCGAPEPTTTTSATPDTTAGPVSTTAAPVVVANPSFTG